ncbi:MAG TPA: phage/plasmid primase, P4 family [Rugosimonospora sp.]|nr:phage/plasmid primase, P4 family [Rugosimonospora sp.]
MSTNKNTAHIHSDKEAVADKVISGTTKTEQKVNGHAIVIDGTIVEPRIGLDCINLLNYPLNDLGNAQRFVAAHGQEARYCHLLESWMVWDGVQWLADRADLARELAQATVTECLRQANCTGDKSAKLMATFQNTGRITNLLREAQPHLTIHPDQLDTAKHLLNFRNGTLNLRTLELRPHSPADFITKSVKHEFRLDAECPRFLQFLAEILPGLEKHMQTAIGYSLTGETIQKAVFVCHGTGDNGKTTLLSTVRELLGDDYAIVIQIESLLTKQENNNSQADLADLRGARFVMTSETEENRELAESRLKRITQGMGKIKAVRKYENPIQFYETHKLWIDGNHKPIVRGTDNAIWNRLHLVPFNRSLTKEEIDRDLPHKLAEEAEGIFAWAALGAVRWYLQGLDRPEIVETARAQWRSDSDIIQHFVEQRCRIAPGFKHPAHDLFLNYIEWAEAARDRIMNESAFKEAMRKKGYEQTRSKKCLNYQGVCANRPPIVEA